MTMMIAICRRKLWVPDRALTAHHSSPGPGSDMGILGRPEDQAETFASCVLPNGNPKVLGTNIEKIQVLSQAGVLYAPKFTTPQKPKPRTANSKSPGQNAATRKLETRNSRTVKLIMPKP